MESYRTQQEQDEVQGGRPQARRLAPGRPKCWPYNTDDPLVALYWAAGDLAEYPRDDVRWRRFFFHLTRAAVAQGDRPGFGWQLSEFWPDFDDPALQPRSSPMEPAPAHDVTERVHDLKVWPQPFQSMSLGLKPFDIRFDHRDYRVADMLVLKEWDPQAAKEGGSEEHGYTGRSIRARITFAMRHDDAAPSWNEHIGVAAGFVVLGLNVFTITGRRIAVGSVMRALEYAHPQVLVEGESEI